MLKVNLRILMAQQKISSITKLMKMSKLSRSALTKIYKEENVEKTELNTLLKLCDAFNCKLSDLIEYIPNKNNKL